MKSDDPHSQYRLRIAHDFLISELVDNTELSVKCINYMLKRFEGTDQNHMIEKLVLAVLSKGTFRSNMCIQLPQTQDKRVQIEKTKLYPHQLMYKLFRNRDIMSKEQIRSKPCCTFGFDAKLPYVCINPYHYYQKLPVVSEGEEKSRSETDSFNQSILSSEKYISSINSLCSSSSTYVYGMHHNVFFANNWCDIKYFEVLKDSTGALSSLETFQSGTSQLVRVGSFCGSQPGRMGILLVDNPKRDGYIDAIRQKIKEGFLISYEVKGPENSVYVENNCKELKLCVSNRLMPLKSIDSASMPGMPYSAFPEVQMAPRREWSESFVMEGQKLCIFSQMQFSQRCQEILGSLRNIEKLENSRQKYEFKKRIIQEIVQLKENCIFDLTFCEKDDFKEYVHRGCYFQVSFTRAISFLNNLLTETMPLMSDP